MIARLLAPCAGALKQLFKVIVRCTQQRTSDAVRDHTRERGVALRKNLFGQAEGFEQQLRGDITHPFGGHEF